ncbi:MAG: tRNA (guanosine(37)-N1)-methyltransferase TrmD [Candidatus Levybacteria bacterium]|nr:tRNA (guanosine(37)-N1)-methyltransferase TrmD [Candidatus Levybacteria bacterium]
MKISVITLFPQMFIGPFNYSIINRAKVQGLVEINLIDLREFGVGKHRTVDDKPYGGGAGMILKVDVLQRAIKHSVDKKLTKKEQKVILLSAGGKTYNQEMAKDFSHLKHLIIICGHYEGVDERILNFIDEEVSIGNFILTGGEIPAMAIVDSVIRLVKGVLRQGVTQSESFSQGLLEHPQYTRPKRFGKLSVPQILLSGDHKKIRQWKEKESVKKTRKNLNSKKARNHSPQIQ